MLQLVCRSKTEFTAPASAGAFPFKSYIPISPAIPIPSGTSDPESSTHPTQPSPYRLNRRLQTANLPPSRLNRQLQTASPLHRPLQKIQPQPAPSQPRKPCSSTPNIHSRRLPQFRTPALPRSLHHQTSSVGPDTLSKLHQLVTFRLRLWKDGRVYLQQGGVLCTLILIHRASTVS